MTEARMRVVFMGTPDIAAHILGRLLDEPWIQVVGVVTQPDRVRGRSKAPQPPPVKVLAEQRGVPVIQPEKLKSSEFVDWLRQQQADVAVVAAFGRILPKEVLDIPRLGCVNVHASLLPRHRGAAPIQHAIAAGDAETGVTIMAMDEGLDTGPILLSASLALDPEETSATLHDRLAELGSGTLLEALAVGARGGWSPVPQDPAGATHAASLDREDGAIQWNRPAAELHRLVRAYDPWPGAFTTVRGQHLKVFPFPRRLGCPRPEHSQPGQVVAVGDEGVWVATGDEVVCLTELQLASKRRLPAAEVARGLRLAPGELLG